MENTSVEMEGPVAEAKSQVAERVAAIGNTIERLKGAFAKLEGRVEKVLRADECISKPNEMPQDALVPLAAELSAHNDALERLAEKIYHLIDRIEI